MEHRRLLLILVLSVVVAAGVLVYAFSLDEWGETGGVLLPLVFLAAAASALISALRMARAGKHK